MKRYKNKAGGPGFSPGTAVLSLRGFLVFWEGFPPEPDWVKSDNKSKFIGGLVLIK